MDEIKFTINGKLHTVSNSCPVYTSLNSYLRNYANLRGTKAMCHEGGCGACIVSVSALDTVTRKPKTFSVNSCLVSIFSCHGWAITTIEGLGNKKDGYHPIQTRLAAFNGTQCGYCTPGWVMNMHSLRESKKDDLTMAEVENSFAGNICRCTGYRPIMDAFKTFSKDCDKELLDKIDDIEELSGVKACAKSGLICTKSCNDFSITNGECKIKMEVPLEDVQQLERKKISIDIENHKWFKVYNVSDIMDILEKEKENNYMLVAGNTAKGVYHIKEYPKLLIDISDVAELKKFSINESEIILGGNMTLNQVMDIFKELKSDQFKYVKQMYNHLDLVAHMPVRNVGTLAGNLMIKYQNNEFQSDVFVLFEAIGAIINIIDKDSKMSLHVRDFLTLPMSNRIIHSITLPALTKNYLFHSYKIMPRAQNSHATVNAAFLIKLDEKSTTVESASLVYGGISQDFVHATSTESFLKGKSFYNQNTIRGAIECLKKEIIPSECSPEPSTAYRKKLAINLFYKFVLHVSNKNDFDEKEKSGGIDVARPVSSGKQDFETNKDVWPLNKPVSKVEALVQCSGEATFANDLPTQPGELYAAYILSTVYSGTIVKIDPSEALKIKGVVGIFTADDIPGINSFNVFRDDVEEVFCSEKVEYYGQPLGVIVAETEQLANLASEKVKVTYKDIPGSKPLLTPRQSLEAPGVADRIMQHKKVEPKTKGTNVQKVIKGSFDFHGQYHYTMETQTCVCVPVEDGLDLYPATQWLDLANAAICKALNIPENKVNIKVRRLGGGYGSKITRTAQLSVACALAAYKLNRPVRFVMSMESNMLAVGKRQSYATDYEVGVDDNGKIQYLINKYYGDSGCSFNDTGVWYSLMYISNCYNSESWDVEATSILTHTAANIACRAPGTTEAIAMIENIMEHIAVELGKDPVEIRLANMQTEDSPLPEMLDSLKQSAEWDRRVEDVKLFNANNLWKKRGISLVPLKYDLHLWGNFTSMVSIYHTDGTVAISSAGVEMGQGLNTKMVQTCAHILGIPMEKIVVKAANNFTAPNAMVSGGSIASEVCCYATMRACEIILERLKPIKAEMEKPTWEELIEKAHASQVDLNAHYMFTPKDGVKPYVIWAATVAEVEVDILTGNHQVLRVDIMEDTGESLSPQIDVGQVEGAFIMGLGYWTMERLIYDENTGALLTNRSWNYKPPGAKDIPIDFRIVFRRNAPNPCGVLRSKATGEPPLNMAVSIPFAIRQAVRSARVDKGYSQSEWFTMNAPYTAENILLATQIDVYQ